jgi:hypothetical protein
LRAHFLSLLPNPQLEDSLDAQVGSSSEFLCQASCLGQRFFDPFYDRRDISRFEIACREVLD